MKTIIAILLTLNLVAQDEYVRMDPKPFDWTKTACVTYFGGAMASMVIVPANLPADKIKHLGAGWVIGFGGNIAAYQFTHNKWASFFLGSALAASAGLGKEYIYDRNSEGHTVSRKDALTTVIGGVIGSIGATWYLDKPRKNKPIYNP